MSFDGVETNLTKNSSLYEWKLRWFDVVQFILGSLISIGLFIIGIKLAQGNDKILQGQLRLLEEISKLNNQSLQQITLLTSLTMSNNLMIIKQTEVAINTNIQTQVLTNLTDSNHQILIQQLIQQSLLNVLNNQSLQQINLLTNITQSNNQLILKQTDSLIGINKQSIALNNLTMINQDILSQQLIQQQQSSDLTDKINHNSKMSLLFNRQSMQQQYITTNPNDTITCTFVTQLKSVYGEANLIITLGNFNNSCDQYIGINGVSIRVCMISAKAYNYVNSLFCEGLYSAGYSDDGSKFCVQASSCFSYDYKFTGVGSLGVKGCFNATKFSYSQDSSIISCL